MSFYVTPNKSILFDFGDFFSMLQLVIGGRNSERKI